MEIEFDAAKDAANIAKHGVSLALAREFTTSRFCAGRDAKKRVFRPSATSTESIIASSSCFD